MELGGTHASQLRRDSAYVISSARPSDNASGSAPSRTRNGITPILTARCPTRPLATISVSIKLYAVVTSLVSAGPARAVPGVAAGLRMLDSNAAVSSDGASCAMDASASAHRSNALTAAARSPLAACARINARQAPSCAGSMAINASAAPTRASDPTSTLSSTGAWHIANHFSARPRANPDSRSLCADRHRSNAGSSPTKSSSKPGRNNSSTSRRTVPARDSACVSTQTTSCSGRLARKLPSDKCVRSTKNKPGSIPPSKLTNSCTA